MSYDEKIEELNRLQEVVEKASYDAERAVKRVLDADAKAKDVAKEVSDMKLKGALLEAATTESCVDECADHTDMWRHRSISMACSSCMWFMPKGNAPLGRCRKHAPTMTGFPAVYVNDWCGDHKLDENKI